MTENPIKKSVNKYAQMCFKQLLGHIIKRGKLNKAQKHLGKSCSLIKEYIKTKKTGGTVLKFIAQAISNVKPLITLETSWNSKSKVGILTLARSIFMACKWLVAGARARTERTFYYRLFLELLDANLKKGFAFKKKIEWYNRCR